MEFVLDGKKERPLVTLAVALAPGEASQRDQEADVSRLSRPTEEVSAIAFALGAMRKDDGQFWVELSRVRTLHRGCGKSLPSAVVAETESEFLGLTAALMKDYENPWLCTWLEENLKLRCLQRRAFSSGIELSWLPGIDRLGFSVGRRDASHLRLSARGDGQRSGTPLPKMLEGMGLPVSDDLGDLERLELLAAGTFVGVIEALSQVAWLDEEARERSLGAFFGHLGSQAQKQPHFSQWQQSSFRATRLTLWALWPWPCEA